MITQSATTAITHEVTVAECEYAPGNLGELTQYLPFELVDDVLAQTRTVQRRLRALPSRVGVRSDLTFADVRGSAPGVCKTVGYSGGGE